MQFQDIPISTVSYNNFSQLGSQKFSTDLTLLEESQRIRIINSYFNQGLEGSHSRVILRDEVLQRLHIMIEKFPSNYSFCVFDGFRTLQTQVSLFNQFFNKFKSHDLDDKDAFITAKKFVPYPGDKDCFEVLPHNSAGAVDLNICVNSEALDMGTDFDDISELSRTDFFEGGYDPKYHFSQERWMTVRSNRRILFNAMTSLGFTNHPLEWWHYNLGNQPWAEDLKEEAVFTSWYCILSTIL